MTQLSAILKGKAKGEDLPPERPQELYVLAEVLDIAGSRKAGRVPAILGVMTQRFKSLQMKSLGKNYRMLLVSSQTWLAGVSRVWFQGQAVYPSRQLWMVATTAPRFREPSR